MRDRICAVVRQPEPAASADACAQLPPTRIDMPTRSSTARLEQRREELNKLQTTSRAFKEARSVIPRGTGRDKLWYKSGQYWGKAYTIGLILVCRFSPTTPASSSAGSMIKRGPGMICKMDPRNLLLLQRNDLSRRLLSSAYTCCHVALAFGLASRH